MKKLKTDQLQPGMAVAKDILDISGNLLVAEGVILNGPLISRLAQREIDLVWVKSDEEEIPLTQEEKEKITEEIKEDLDKRFHLVAEVPLMKGLKERIFDYLVRKRTE